MEDMPDLHQIWDRAHNGDFGHGTSMHGQHPSRAWTCASILLVFPRVSIFTYKSSLAAILLHDETQIHSWMWRALHWTRQLYTAMS